MRPSIRFCLLTVFPIEVLSHLPARPSRIAVADEVTGVFTVSQARRGQDAYGTKCATCHGAGLEGNDAPALMGTAFLQKFGSAERLHGRESCPGTTPRSARPLRSTAAAMLSCALETGRLLIRATNNGVSVLIDRHGAITVCCGQFIREIIRGSAQSTTGLTPFARRGSWSVAVFVAALVVAARAPSTFGQAATVREARSRGST